MITFRSLTELFVQHFRSKYVRHIRMVINPSSGLPGSRTSVQIVLRDGVKEDFVALEEVDDGEDSRQVVDDCCERLLFKGFERHLNEKIAGDFRDRLKKWALKKVEEDKSFFEEWVEDDVRQGECMVSVAQILQFIETYK